MTNQANTSVQNALTKLVRDKLVIKTYHNGLNAANHHPVTFRLSEEGRNYEMPEKTTFIIED